VVAKAHHTMVDGRSGADLVQSLLTSVPDAPPPRAAIVDARPAPSLVGLVGDLLAWLVLLPFRAIRLVVRSLRGPREARCRVKQVRLGLAQVLRPDLPPSILTGPLGPRRIWGWTRADLAVVTRVTRTADCTVNDVFLASLAGGYRRYLLDRGAPGRDGSPGRSCRCPQSARTARATGEPGLGDVRGTAGRPGGLAARLHAVAARTADQKSREVADATAAVVQMADHIPAALFALGARAYGRSGQGRSTWSPRTSPARRRRGTWRAAGTQLVPYVPTAQEIRASAAMVSCAGQLDRSRGRRGLPTLIASSSLSDGSSAISWRSLAVPAHGDRQRSRRSDEVPNYLALKYEASG
jgi:diacylglycerol O-acyltransferase